MYIIFSIHKSESEITQSCTTLCDPMGWNYQATLSMGFSRQAYWSGLLFPSPGDLPDPGIEPRSPALQADALPSEPPGKPFQYITNMKITNELLYIHFFVPNVENPMVFYTHGISPFRPATFQGWEAACGPGLHIGRCRSDDCSGDCTKGTQWMSTE